MKYIGMNPIGRRPGIEVVHDGHLYDLHNTADFKDYVFDQATRTLTLNWEFGCYCDGVKGGPISLVFAHVADLKIADKDPSVPRSEDLCLEEMWEVSDDSLFFLFRGGQSFTIRCDSVTFDPKQTKAHRLKDG
jgi:hypothetical protein